MLCVAAPEAEMNFMSPVKKKKMGVSRLLKSQRKKKLQGKRKEIERKSRKPRFPREPKIFPVDI